MTRTTGRTLALLSLLQSRREWSGAELQSRLEVSYRTLRRDIDDLRSLGYGIDASPGVGGGYRLGVGATVPPLALSADEAVAIAVGLRAAALGAVTGMEDASARALAKLETSLSPATRSQISQVEQAMVPLGASRADIDLDAVVSVARAISDDLRLRIRYRRHDGEEVERRIEPHRIVHTTERWYLIGWDADRAAWRTLRLDRVVEVTTLRQTFAPRAIPDDELRAFTTQSITTAPYRYRVRVRMRAPASEVAREFGPTVAEVVDESADTSILTTGSDSPSDIAYYLVTGGFDFEILEGDEVRQALTVLAERAARALG